MSQKICLRGFRPVPTKTGLYTATVDGYWLEISDLGSSSGCTIYVAKTKALISCTVTGQLIFAFVSTYAKGRFSHEVARVLSRPHTSFCGFECWIVSNLIVNPKDGFSCDNAQKQLLFFQVYDILSVSVPVPNST